MKRGLRLLLIVVSSYLGLMLFAYLLADRMIFQPPAPSYESTDEVFVSFGEDDNFAGLYYPPRSDGEVVFLWSHGNAEDAGHVRHLAKSLSLQGFGTLAYDYPGYGKSSGTPGGEGTLVAADAAFQFLTREKGIASSNIILVGQSVGSGPATHLAAKTNAAGLILISPFKSAFRVVTKVRLFPFDRFDNWKGLQEVTMPLLVIHGENDEVIPYSHGQALFERYEGEKEMLTVPGVGHNDLWFRSREKVFDRMVKFSRRATTSGGS
jgi:pimeloyl-ACP methyl ester carboxylesterase